MADLRIRPGVPIVGALVTAIVSPAVARVAANWHRRASWMDADELLAEAAMVAVETARTWREDLGPLENYQASAVARRLGRHVVQQASPVSLHQTATATKREDLDELASAGERPAAEWHLDHERACQEVRRILAQKSPAARAVLLDERKPAEVASELGVPVRQVYVEIKSATRALQSSRKLAMLAQAVCS
jgi:DNA-directed RNA polymerase specialized sigma24 family protein